MGARDGLFSASKLKSVGTLGISGSSAVLLPNLESAGYFGVNSRSLRQFSMPNLKHVTGDLFSKIELHPSSILEVEFPSLLSVTGQVRLWGNSMSLPTFPNVWSIGGPIDIEQNQPQPPSYNGMPNLRCVDDEKARLINCSESLKSRIAAAAAAWGSDACSV